MILFLKKFNNIIFGLIALLSFFFSMEIVNAYSINKIDMDIYISAMSSDNNIEGEWLFIIAYIIIGFVIFGVTRRSRGNYGQLVFEPDDKTLPDDADINYWREIPCNKNLERAYWVAFHYSVVPVNILKDNIVGAILLKWLRDGQIDIINTKEKGLNLKDNDYAVDLNKIKDLDNEYEKKLLNLLKKAAGLNEKLEIKEFERWCKKNYFIMNEWFEGIINYETKELEKKGLITPSLKETEDLLDKKNAPIEYAKSELKNEAIQLKGLMKFLLDFSNMPEREYLQVHMWEEYLIFAQLLGIADKVEEQFSKLYPKFNEVSKININANTTIIRRISYSSAEGRRAAISFYSFVIFFAFVWFSILSFFIYSAIKMGDIVAILFILSFILLGAIITYGVIKTFHSLLKD